MPQLDLDDYENAVIPRFQYIQTYDTIYYHPESFNNGDIIFCKTKKGIFLKQENSIERYGGEDVYDNTTSTSTKNPLSANMGRILNEKIEVLDNKKINISDIVDNLNNDGISTRTQPLSAYQGYILDTKKINYSDIVNNLNANNSTFDSKKVLSAYQGYILDKKINQNNSQLTQHVNDELDRIDQKTTNTIEIFKIDFADKLSKKLDIDVGIKNNLISNNPIDDSHKALSAYQGYILNTYINELRNNLTNKVGFSNIKDNLNSNNQIDHTNVLSAYQGYVLDQKKADKTELIDQDNTLRDLIASITVKVIDALVSDNPTKDALSVNQGRLLQNNIQEAYNHIDSAIEYIDSVKAYLEGIIEARKMVTYVERTDPYVYDVTYLDLENHDIISYGESTVSVIDTRLDKFYESKSRVVYVTEKE